MQTKTNHKLYGWVWIFISPVLWVMAAISTVESTKTYYIQLTCFSVVATIGLISGVASLFKCHWAYVALKYLSWLGFIFFSGAGLLMILFTLTSLFKEYSNSALLIIPVAIGVVLTGLPFYYMAKKLGSKMQ